VCLCAQVCRIRRVWPGCWPGHVLGSAGSEQPAQPGAQLPGLCAAPELCTCAAAGARRLHAARPAASRGLLRRGWLRAAQVVSHWSLADESEKWGAPAMPRSAVLTQFFPRLAKVVVWLATAPGPLPYSLSAPAAAAFRKNSLTLYTRVRIVARSCNCTQSSEHAIDLVTA